MARTFTKAAIINSQALYQIADTLIYDTKFYYKKMYPINNLHINEMLGATSSVLSHGISVEERRDLIYTGVLDKCEATYNGSTCYQPFQRIHCELRYDHDHDNYAVGASVKYQWHANPVLGVYFWHCNYSNGEVGLQLNYNYQPFDCDGITSTSFIDQIGEYSIPQGKPLIGKDLSNMQCDWLNGVNGHPIINGIGIMKRSEWCTTGLIERQCGMSAE